MRADLMRRPGDGEVEEEGAEKGRCKGGGGRGEEGRCGSGRRRAGQRSGGGSGADLARCRHEGPSSAPCCSWPGAEVGAAKGGVGTALGGEWRASRALMGRAGSGRAALAGAGRLQPW
nr:glycine-rich cell wall structural protein 1.8-like [Aegilops tauschii subsp. strangulata]